MIIDENVYLEHFGVKGMRWGVKKTTPGDKDISLTRGTKVFNISARNERDLKGQVYTAHKLKDVMNYRANYAFTQSFGNVPVFSNAFVVTKGIKAAGRESQIKTFKKLWDQDPQAMAKALADVQKDMKFAAAFNARILKLKRDGIYEKRILNKGEDWVRTKGLQEFNASLAVNTAAVSTSKNKVDQGRKIDTTLRDKYFKELSKRGYNAILDLNDVKNYGSEEPLLVFKGNTALKKSGKPIKLTSSDMAKAADILVSKKKLAEYRDTLHSK